MKLELKANTHLMNSQEIHIKKKKIYVCKGRTESDPVTVSAYSAHRNVIDICR